MNESETYLTTREVAELTGLRMRSIQRNCQKREYEVKEWKSRKNGRKYAIALSSLPVEVQERVESKRSKAVSRQSEGLSVMPEWKRKIAFERFEILQGWEKYAREKGRGTSKCVDEFCAEVLEGKHARPSLYRWKKRLKQGGMAALAPDWKNGKKPLGDEMFFPEAKDWVRDFWLHPNQPSMKLAFREVKKQAEVEGWKVPSYASVKQLLNAIPKPVRDKYRRGSKYMDDRIYPYLERDNTKLKPMEIIVADHHQLDIATRMPDGRIIFPWLTGFEDLRTNKILNWVLVSQPNSDSINISLYEMISKYGLGDYLLLDNGKDFRCRFFTGEKQKNWVWKKIRLEIDENQWEGIYKELGYKGVIWAKPRNAKAKKIERFFKEVVNQFSVYFRSFRGRKVSERPEGLQKQIKKGDVVEFEELKKRLHQFIDIRYNEKRPHYGKGMEGRTPNQVFYELKTKKRAVREEELTLLMSKVHKPAQVRQQGVLLLDGWYWNDKVQMEHFGEMIRPRYVEHKPEKAYFYDMNWKFLGIAERRPDATFFMESEDFRKNLRYQKHLKEAIKYWEQQNLPESRMTGIEREALLDEDEIQEPVLEPQYVRTKYAPVVAAEAIEKEKKQKQKKAKQDFANKYDNLGFDDQYNVLIEKEVAKFLLEYGRQEV